MIERKSNFGQCVLKITSLLEILFLETELVEKEDVKKEVCIAAADALWGFLFRATLLEIECS